jgi:transcriptional regulator with XRE-family HTH domain
VNIHQLLLEHYLAWLKEEGEVKSWKDFAETIGIDNVYLNKIYNGKRNAGEKTIKQLADYFHDPRFYDVGGIDRPEPLLNYTRRNWGSVPDEIKNQIAEDVSKYTSEPVPGKEGTDTTKP